MAKLTTSKAIERSNELTEFIREQHEAAQTAENWLEAGRLEDALRLSAAVTVFLAGDQSPDAQL